MNFNNLYTRHKALVHSQFIDAQWVEFMEAAERFSPDIWNLALHSTTNIDFIMEHSDTEEEVVISCLFELFDNIIHDVVKGQQDDWHTTTHLAWVWCFDRDIETKLEFDKILIRPSHGELPTLIID
ncbi:hypothetical protein MCP1_340015 [Candidatus Terasakiella magnetica]|nr:hypothetical protein MCP1_340015 [Candidatus Terasakiella magnetica]